MPGPALRLIFRKAGGLVAARCACVCRRRAPHAVPVPLAPYSDPQVPVAA